MNRRINVTKGHSVALKEVLDYAGLPETVRAPLVDLLHRMVDAPATSATPAPGMSIARLIEVVAPLLPTLSLPPESLRTKQWYSKVGKMLQVSGLDEATLVQLVRHVATWASMPITLETLLYKAPEWAAKAHGKTKQADTSQPPKGLFDD